MARSGEEYEVERHLKALGDESENVRKLAAIALVEIGDPRAVEPLIRAEERR